MDNLQALNKTVDAIRGIERWGTGEMMRAAFAGFKAIPEKAESTDASCWEILGISSTKEEAVINRAYNNKAKECHPDSGGSHEQMVRLNNARKTAIQLANK